VAGTKTIRTRQIGAVWIATAAMAFFPFAGSRDSFFGDLQGQGKDAIDFFTEKKLVIERWF